MESNKNKDLKSKLEFTDSLSNKIALMITGIFGSMKFLCSCIIFFMLWIIWNLGIVSFLKPFDPYPFSMLTMLVSLFAIILSVSVLISQNREGKMDSIRQQVEFEVNVRAEDEITKVLEMLHDIQKKIGINKSTDAELEQMKESLDIKKLHEKLKDDDSDMT